MTNNQIQKNCNASLMHAPRSSHYTPFSPNPPPPPPSHLPPAARPPNLRSRTTTTIPNPTLHHQHRTHKTNPRKSTATAHLPLPSTTPPHHLHSHIRECKIRRLLSSRCPTPPLELPGSGTVPRLPHTHLQHGGAKTLYFGAPGVRNARAEWWDVRAGGGEGFEL